MGDRLVEATGQLPSDGASIDLGALTGKSWPCIAAQMGPAGLMLRDDLASLIQRGTAFLGHIDLGCRGIFRVEGETRGPSAIIAIFAATPGEQALVGRLAREQHLGGERSRAGALMDLAPLAAFDFAPDGTLQAGNKAAAALLPTVRSLTTLRHVLPDKRGPVAADATDRENLVVEVTESTAPGGGTFVYVDDISARARAEHHFASIMMTLTDTFAHLSVGLAVFDRDRKLTLFNPALSDLFGLPAVQLAGMPTVRMFLESLRRSRMLPEQTDFTAWRDALAARLDKANTAPFSEDWTLPSGQIMRVTARPHPRGAVALMFEDISGHVNLERRYHTEMELGQVTLERMAEAVAVLSSSGKVLFANAAFEAAFGFNAFSEIMAEGIDPLIDLASEIYSPAEAWTDLKAYALAADRIDRWDRVVTHIAGDPALLRASALPDGSTLLTVPIRSTGLASADDLADPQGCAPLATLHHEPGSQRVL